MRITGGRARGISLEVPKGQQVRPSTDRLREAVFSRLGPAISGATVFDLFAGSGSYGLEAMSRGAAEVLWVESDRRALAALKNNAQAVAKSMGGDLHPRIIDSDVTRWEPAATADFIFMDPPYAKFSHLIPPLLERARGWLSGEDHARLILEMPGRIEPDFPGWVCERRLGKGGGDAPTAAILARA